MQCRACRGEFRADFLHPLTVVAVVDGIDLLLADHTAVDHLVLGGEADICQLATGKRDEIGVA